MFPGGGGGRRLTGGGTPPARPVGAEDGPQTASAPNRVSLLRQVTPLGGDHVTGGKEGGPSSQLGVGAPVDGKMAGHAIPTRPELSAGGTGNIKVQQYWTKSSVGGLKRCPTTSAGVWGVQGTWMAVDGKQDPGLRRSSESCFFSSSRHGHAPELSILYVLQYSQTLD